MQPGVVRWVSVALAALLLAQSVLTSPLAPRPPRGRRVSRQAQYENVELVPSQTLDQYPQVLSEDLLSAGAEHDLQGPRDKRTLKKVVNLLFWKINTLLELKTRLLAQISERQRLGGRVVSTTPDPAEDDVPEFDSNRVMLDIPGELFGTAFSVVTDISKIVGDVILNTARRTQRFIEALKPALARTLGYKIAAFTGASSVSTNGQDQSEATDTTGVQNDV